MTTVSIYLFLCILIVFSKIQGLDAKIQEANNKMVNDDRLGKCVKIVAYILISESDVIVD